MVDVLVTVVLFILVIRWASFFIARRKTTGDVHDIDLHMWRSYLVYFVGGCLFANAVPHFFHGVSGEYFPAPFGKYLGRGFAEHLSNVVWGMINLVCGYNLLISGKVASGDKLRAWSCFAGMLAMGVFLCFVFSHGHR